MQKIPLKKRTYTLYKKDNFTITSKGMITSWKIISDVSFVPILYINEIKITTPRKEKNVLSIAEIRGYIRDMDVLTEQNHNKLDKVENMCYLSQLYGIEHYKTLTNEELFNSIFTRDLSIRISFGNNDSVPEEVEIEEEYWDRNHHKNIENENVNDKEFQEQMLNKNIINDIIENAVEIKL